MQKGHQLEMVTYMSKATRTLGVVKRKIPGMLLQYFEVTLYCDVVAARVQLQMSSRGRSSLWCHNRLQSFLSFSHLFSYKKIIVFLLFGSKKLINPLFSTKKGLFRLFSTKKKFLSYF